MKVLVFLMVLIGLTKGQIGLELFQLGTSDIWEADDNRLCDRDLIYNANPGSGGSIFEFVNETAFAGKPTFMMFEDLLTRYNIYEGQPDTCDCEADERAFIRAVMATGPMIMAQNFIATFDAGIFSDDAFFEEYLYEMWFAPYSREFGLDSSGFQHVFVGEIKADGGIGGFHNWIRMYREELTNDFQFSNQVTTPCSSDIASFSHIWMGQSKSINSMWVRTSPEVELAIYTMCFRFYTNQVCEARLDNNFVRIQNYDWQGGNSVGASYTLCS